MSACPDKNALLHSYVDGELDAANSVTFEGHMETCPGCAAEVARMMALRTRLRSVDLRHAAPAGWRERAMEALPAQPAAVRMAPPIAAVPLRAALAAITGRAGSFLSGGAIGLAAGLVLALALPHASLPVARMPEGQSGQEQLVASHVRSLLAQHLTDVASSDRHQVRPWFNGRIDFAPPTPDLAPQGFPLSGGRLDYIDGRVVAAIVYRRRLHPLNLFVRPVAADTPDKPVTGKAEGYNLERWRQGDLEYWVISDLNARELQLFQREFVAATSR